MTDNTQQARAASIPDAAIEAALRALFPDDATVEGFKRAVQEPIVKSILEAAAPYIRAQALEEAAAEVDEGVPAYGQDGYADWLRERAASESGERG